MTTYNGPDFPRSQRIACVHAGAISVAFVSGTLALVALLLGSPMEFGSALAVCGAAWIVANFAERLAEQKRTRCRRALASKRRANSSSFVPGYVRLGGPAQARRVSATAPRFDLASCT